jgi:hypothetical protein
MREWWANVYAGDASYENMGVDYPTRGQAAAYDGEDTEYRPVARIHVRLKPEGAPRRYASEAERGWWELHPLTAAMLNRIDSSSSNALLSQVPPHE